VHRLTKWSLRASCVSKKFPPFKKLGIRQRTGTGLEAMKIVMAIIMAKPFTDEEGERADGGTGGIGIMPILAVVTLFGLLLAAAPTQAQEHHANHGYQGQHGVGHEHWHQQFYSKLMRKDTRTSCCNLSDCVPTQSRMINDHYEVLVEGEWTKVPQDVIQNVAAPDGGAHVCFPKQPSNRYPKGTLFCVVLPPET
jgi:hypothetical protein